MYSVITFYKYCNIDDPDQLRDDLLHYCTEHGVFGRILLGKEGINAGVSGRAEEIKKLKVFIEKSFSGMTYREESASKCTYHKLVVRVRDEICTLGVEADLSHTGNHLSPKQVKELLDRNEDIILLDARNDYEFDVGKFKNATTLPLASFRDFPKEIEKHPEWKDKKVVMYCTGGIRCEKSSAYLKEQGFSDVNQLQGGIINYCQQFPGTHWAGSLYVFDDRQTSDQGSAPITHCKHCDTDCDQVINCFSVDCDKRFICCDECSEKMLHTCCYACRTAPRQREVEKRPTMSIGKVENYFEKASAALVKLNKTLDSTMTIEFSGNTTDDFSQSIVEMRDYDGNVIKHANAGQEITLFVNQKVRKNDVVSVVH